MNPTERLGEIVFLGKVLEQIYLTLVKIDTDPSCTLEDVKEDLVSAARLVKEEIGETRL